MEDGSGSGTDWYVDSVKMNFFKDQKLWKGWRQFWIRRKMNLSFFTYTNIFCKNLKYKIKPNFSNHKIRTPLASFSAFLKKKVERQNQVQTFEVLNQIDRACITMTSNKWWWSTIFLVWYHCCDTAFTIHIHEPEQLFWASTHCTLNSGASVYISGMLVMVVWLTFGLVKSPPIE